MSDQHDNNQLLPIPLDVAIKFASLIETNFFIQKKNGDHVEISHKSSHLKNTFESYKNNGLKQIWLKPEDFASLKEKLNTVIEQRDHYKEALKDISKMFEMAKATLSELGFKSSTLKTCEDINKNVFRELKRMPGLMELVMEHKKSNNQQFYYYVVASFLANAMVETFTWQSEALKKKVSTACLFCDILLDPADYEFMENNPFEKWSSKQKNHPLDTAESLKNTWPEVPTEVLQMIEHHHEKPEGKGYPRGINNNQLPLLSGLMIVAVTMTEKVLDKDFTKESKEAVMEEMMGTFNKGVFRTAFESLYRAMEMKL